jgi:beta-glucuronidase
MKQSYRRDSIIKTIFFIHLLIVVSGINSSAQAQSDARFQLQNIDSRQSDNLDGLWSIIVDPLENGYYNHRWFPKEDGYFKNKKMETPSDLIEYDFDTDELLMVPGDWNTQAEKLYYYEGTMWYKTEFEFTTSEEEQENYLHFGAINYEALIYLNGEKVGEHIGGYTSFSLNVTDFLNEGNNVLILKVDNKRKREGVPTINTDWWNYGGITRSVHLVSTPKKHIYDYFIQLNAEQKDIISGWVLMKNSERGDHVQLEIPELEIQTTVVVNDDGMGAFSFSASPDLWSPTNPKLYEVLLTIEKEVISDEIGFRTIETQGSKILLNGEAIFLKGISIHEEAPFKTGRVTSIEEVRVLLKWAKELGCNFVRLAHYPHSELMIREAEKLGLMVWSEIPVYWTVLFEHEETYQNAENQLKEMIARDKNRAGVVLWSIANETPLSEPRLTFLRKLAAIARSLDQTRLITAALDTQTRRAGENIIDDPLGEYVDVIGVNSYCGWYGGTPSSCKNLKWGSEYDKPVIFSEFGGGALQGLHGEDNERWTEEYQAAVYRNNIEMLKNIEFLAGTSPWILMDFRSHRRHLKRIQADFNRKGLISEQGVKKESFYIMQEYYNSIEY